jgi:hypothetical protein
MAMYSAFVVKPAGAAWDLMAYLNENIPPAYIAVFLIIWMTILLPLVLFFFFPKVVGD